MHCVHLSHNTLILLVPQCTVSTCPIMHCFHFATIHCTCIHLSQYALLSLIPQCTAFTCPNMHCFHLFHNALYSHLPQYALFTTFNMLHSCISHRTVFRLSFTCILHLLRTIQALLQPSTEFNSRIDEAST